MMNKMRSAKVHLLKLLFLLPLVAVLLVAFRDQDTGLLGPHGRVYVNAPAIVIDPSDRMQLEGVEDTVPDKGTGPIRTVRIGGGPGGPLFYINGREVPGDTLKNLNPDRISSIQVLKDSAALNLPEYRPYGERAKNGIVIIHLKGEKIPGN